MIIKKCDVCKKEVDYLNTVILYKTPIDYCNKCKNKIQNLIEDFKKEVAFENVMLDNNLKQKEKKYLKKFKAVI